MPFIPDKDEPKSPPVCRHPEHSPPNMIVWQRSGTWVCPSCGVRTRVRASQTMCRKRGVCVDAVSNIFTPEQPSKATIRC